MAGKHGLFQMLCFSFHVRVIVMNHLSSNRHIIQNHHSNTPPQDKQHKICVLFVSFCLCVQKRPRRVTGFCDVVGFESDSARHTDSVRGGTESCRL